MGNPSHVHVILPVESAAEKCAFTALSRNYLVGHLADVGAHLGRSIDVEPYLAKEDNWLSALLGKGNAWIARDDAGPCGIVALDLRRGVAEIKRLFVTERARGQGLGKRLAEHAITAAFRRGHERIRLDTFVGMTDAIRLYERLGFRAVEPYLADELPPELINSWRFMERETSAC